jgi:hypothetical protein
MIKCETWPEHVGANMERRFKSIPELLLRVVEGGK